MRSCGIACRTDRVRNNSDFGNTFFGLLCGLAAAAIWGGGSVVSRHLVTSGLGPADLTLLRYAGCFPVAVVALLLMGNRIWLGVSWPRLAVLLILGGPLYHVIVIAGYRYTSAGGGALLMSGLLPLFALALHWVIKSTTPPRTKVVGALLVLAGLGWFGLEIGSAVSLTGVILFAIAALAWAVLNELVRAWQVDPLRLTVLLALFAPAFAPLYFFTESGNPLASPPEDLLLQIAYHGLLVAIGATALFFLAVRLAGAEIAAVLQSTSPGFAAILGAAFLGEPLLPAQLGSLMLVTFGVYVSVSDSTPNLLGRWQVKLPLQPRLDRWTSSRA